MIAEIKFNISEYKSRDQQRLLQTNQMTKEIIQNKQQKKIQKKIENQPQNQRGQIMNGGEEGSSIIDGNLSEAILQEELIPPTIHYYSAAPAPGLVPADNQDADNYDGESNPSSDPVRICKKTIKKQKKVNRPIGLTQLRRKVNHRKYTVKKCSNYLRKHLKKNGFKDFQLLQGDRNKRGSTIYFSVALLILRNILKEEFGNFVVSFVKELDRLRDIEERKYRVNRNDKSKHYIIEFKRAKSSIELFVQGKEMECIAEFFGAHQNSYKEATYLQDSIKFYNDWRASLGENTDCLRPVATESTNETESIESIENSSELIQLQTPIHRQINSSQEFDIGVYFF